MSYRDDCTIEFHGKLYFVELTRESFLEWLAKYPQQKVTLFKTKPLNDETACASVPISALKLVGHDDKDQNPS